MTGAAAATAEIWLHDESELGAAVRDVARRMAGALDAVRGRRETVVRDVRVADAAYRVRGAVLDQAESSQPAIVVMLERVDEMPSTDTIREAFGLTRKEAGVARLLAEGLSNAEVADALTISFHTARHHTASVLAKLEVASRREVRDRLAEAAYVVN